MNILCTAGKITFGEAYVRHKCKLINAFVSSEAPFFSGMELVIVEDAATSEVLFDSSTPLVCRELKAKLELDKLKWKKNDLAVVKCPLAANDSKPFDMFS